MTKKILSLGSDGKLVLIGPEGKVEDIPRAPNSFSHLVIDCSGSMEGNKLTQAKKGSIDFARDAIKKGYAIGLIKFDSSARLLCEPVIDINVICHHIEELAAGDTTNMAHGIQVALQSLNPRKGTRAIIVVTDGIPDDAQAALNAAQHAKDRGIDVITIGTDDADKAFLNRLASRSDLAVKVSSDQLGQSIASAAKMLPGGTNG